MARTVTAERFSLAALWQIALDVTSPDHDTQTDTRWESAMKRYPKTATRLMVLAISAQTNPQLKKALELLYVIPFGISPRITEGMFKQGLTGIDKPEANLKLDAEEDDKPAVKVKKVAPTPKHVEQNDINAMLARMEGIGEERLEEV